LKYPVLFLLLILNFHSLTAQISGHVSYEKFGLEFDIPEGWIAQESEGMLVMGHNTIPGLIMMTTHSFNINELKSEARKGIVEENGTQLFLSGEVVDLSANAIGGNFAGTIEGMPAKAYIIGMENPTGGRGVSIMTATSNDYYNQSYESLAKSIFRSLSFKKVDRSAELNEWKSYLKNSRLTYMKSSYSSSYGDNSSYGGYSSERIIHLCADGHFKYGSSSDVSVGSSGASGFSSSNNSGTGRWEIEIGASGDPVLSLKFNNGEEYIYDLQFSEQELYLNGDRYFHTTDGEYAPDCP
jgi:hypothetical protein